MEGNVREDEARIRLVLAEDDPDLRRILAEQLVGSGKVDVLETVSNGQEVVGALTNHNPDILLLDVEMPVMDGVETAKQVSAQFPHVSIVMYTAFERSERLLEAITAGARGFLTKDMLLNDVLAGLEKVRRGEQLLSPTVTARVLDAARAESAANRRVNEWRDAVEQLSPARREVYELLKQGLSMREIAEELDKSVSTVRVTAADIYQSLLCRSQADLVRQATLFENRYKSLL